MEMSDPVEALAALANPTRLAAFRLLIRHGPDGLAAGALAAGLGVPPSTLSAHLARLETAGLIERRRASRNLFYSVCIDRTRALLSFLLDDCCQGRPELCPPATESLAA